jgi:oligoribonuclease (3'-5' exoribonuclease)
MGRGEVVSGSGKLPAHWPAEAKLAVVIETAALSDIRESVAELRYYRRFMGRLAGNSVSGAPPA